ncbi:hypothetical protein [Lysobacter gummosus]|uniref:Cytochrome c domain-containing protein n=1 Tax=Lysobacter gummosus TaxID=262324 RepID=A0ABY3XIF4_9GAMM|nr:hypothetical protein [Lysobacter gummosus]ALN90947.1 hypothetical protein LG3211_1978 [Lysobacter gummosus]UNP31391.1 hypothetical protein MOV92_09190 [Lysobacter gummosus]
MKTALIAVGLIAATVATAVSQERTAGAAGATPAAAPATAAADAPVRFPSYDPHYPPPPGARDVFQLSQDYPTTFADDTFPWMAIDFKAFPTEYLRSVLDYCLEGNVDVDFKVQNNRVRKWYHAPWLHDDGAQFGGGREWRRGLTRERMARPLDLHRKQTERAQNWAVGFYNDRGAVSLGKVWRTADGRPDPSKSTFADNSVACKLLFTDASTAQIPYLSRTKTWTANIYPDVNYNKPRVDRTVRLLQLDVAVKDPRMADTTGWVFGTFIYDGGAPGPTVWDRMIPVGASWGDDLPVRTDANRDGVFVNTALTQARITSSLVERTGWNYGNRAYVMHHGLGGRLNGPIDSPVSSCISCHGRAGTYAGPTASKRGQPMVMAVFSAAKPSVYPMAQFDEFFKPIPGGSHIETQTGDRYMTTDYSLQLSAGIRNYYQSLRTPPPVADTAPRAGSVGATSVSAPAQEPLRTVDRDGN